MGKLIAILVVFVMWLGAFFSGEPMFWIGAILSTLGFFQGGGIFNSDDSDFGGD